MSSPVRILAALAIFALLAASPAPAAEQILITPAEGIGPCKIGNSFFGMRKPEFSKRLQNGDVIAKYPSHGLIVQYQGYSGEIHFVGVDKASCGKTAYATTDGLRVGMPKSSVESIYGEPDQIVDVTSKDVYPASDKLAIYAKKGISFHYDESGKVVVIIVFSPAIFGK